MPSTSAKQHRFMGAVAHNPAFAKKAGIPVSVGKHFIEADRSKKFKEGGSMKEPKESKAMAAAEMKALKRGHAPKAVMKHESEEHKAMGYRHGGKIQPKMKVVKTPKDESKPTGYGMKETAGGRKTPHGKHATQGDTPLKGFGMSDKSGPGRKVTKPKTAKDETPTKGFGMKKGGHVARHASRKPGMPPAMLAALLGGAGGPPPGAGGPPPDMGAPPMGGPPPGMGGPPGAPPGMKKGGHVIHHHHHYKKGGHVKRMADGGMAVPPPPPSGVIPQGGPTPGGTFINPGEGGAGGPPPPPPPGGMGGDMLGAVPPGGGLLAPNQAAAPAMQQALRRHWNTNKYGTLPGNLGRNARGIYAQQSVPRFAKGGAIRREDGVAERGHTKGKLVKMASGGHVGSHTSRRADGCATKGHTKGRVC